MSRLQRFTKLLVINLLLITVILVVAEIILRQQGYKPGRIWENPLPEVDSLYVLSDYTTDKHGILKVNPEVRTEIKELINISGKDSLLDGRKTHLDWTLRSVTADVLALFNHPNIESEFKDFIDQIGTKPDSRRTAVETAYLEYASMPINESGFRSIAFKNYDTDKKKILFLGDSNTWGLSAEPIINSFVDLLSTKGYVCYNSGIVATDPAQYMAVAQQYIPQLKPDIVVVVFCYNDIMNFKRIPRAGEPPVHVTNAGWLESHIYGCYSDAQTIYQKISNDGNIAGLSPTLFNTICSKTVLTTMLWKVLKSRGLVSSSGAPVTFCNGLEENPVNFTPYYLEKIQELCNLYGAKMLLTLEPNWEDCVMNSNGNYSSCLMRQADEVFPGIEYHFPENLTPSDYYTPFNGHLNNKGMKKFADFLQELVEE